MQFEELFDRSIVIASMRQRRFESQTRDRIWWVDPQNGIAKLYTRDKQLVSDVITIQILGTEGDGEWLWAWANRINFPLPEPLAASEKLRALGESHHITELTSERIPDDALANARSFAAIGLAQADAAGYVLHRVGPLIAVFLVDEPLRTADAEDLGSIAHAVNDVAAAGIGASSARHLLEGVLQALHIRFRADGDVVTAEANGERMTATFSGASYTINVG